MAAPGRTHIPWQSQSGQIQELISYIGFLEAKVSYLQLHHEHCEAWLTPQPSFAKIESNLPYLPPDIVVASDANSASQPMELSSESPPDTFEAEKQSTHIQLVSMQPSKKGVDTNPRWKRIVDQMTRGWDEPSSWIDKRTAIGLDSVAQNKHALTLILGLKSSVSTSWNQSPLEIYEQNTNPVDALITSARQYALDTKVSQLNAGLMMQVHIFRELVFASLCVVMEHQGLPINTINDLMRICMSSSGAANLYRLRRGALWVNRVISGTMMAKMGWGHGGTEFFLLSGRPVSQYGLLWEACMHSFPYLSNRLAHISSIVNVPIDGPGWIPFSIPLIIKQLVGDALTLEQICLALDYNIDTL